MQVQVIYGGHSAMLPLSSYRVPPLLQRPILKERQDLENKIEIVDLLK